MFKIVFFDLDGTLLTDKKDILIENKKAIEDAINNGINVVICSGRQKNAVTYYQKLAGAGRYVISNNGAYIYDTKDNQMLFDAPIEKEKAIALYEFAMQNNMFVRVDTKYARYITDMRYKILDDMPMEEDYKKFFDENEILQISLSSIDARIVDNVVEKLDSELKVENRFITEMIPIKLDMINIVNKSASKGNAILGLCKYLKILPEEAMAFGDDLNDISMMKAVYGVAMGNALDEVKVFSKEVLETTNEEPGIAKVLYRIIDERKSIK